MFRYLTIGLFAFTIYILFSGSITLYDILTGLIVSAIASVILAKTLVKEDSKVIDIRRLFWLIAYILHYMTIIELRAHLDVAKRIINPRMPINPGIVRVPYKTKTDYATVLVSNSITNTPGTVVVDLDENKKILYVHWINVKAIEPDKTYEYISKTFERYAKKIFD